VAVRRQAGKDPPWTSHLFLPNKQNMSEAECGCKIVPSLAAAIYNRVLLSLPWRLFFNLSLCQWPLMFLLIKDDGAYGFGGMLRFAVL
jgi:hypothetical protein